MFRGLYKLSFSGCQSLKAAGTACYSIGQLKPRGIHISPNLCAVMQLGYRLKSSKSSVNNPSEDDSLSSLMDQMKVDDSMSTSLDEDFEYGGGSTNTGGTIPGHRIRGILVPTEETHAHLFGGQRYDELPIAHVKAAYNNTHVVISESSGALLCRSSGGRVGFKNAKTKTNVAALAVGLAAGKEGVEQGLTHVRVELKGIGKGRLAACKGLEQAGLEVVSITDVSVLSWGGRRFRKAKRL